MESRRFSSADRTDRDRRDAASDLRGLQRLRDRIETAAREIERLREENTALAARVAELDGGVDPLAVAVGGESPAALREQIEGFIAAIDAVLREPATEPLPSAESAPREPPPDEPAEAAPPDAPES